MQNFTDSWYDALEVQARRRVGGGNSLQVSYTWSRSMIDGVDFYSTYRGTQRTPQEYGYNSTDRTHNLSVSASQTLPWTIQFSVIARYLSGQPIGASAGVDLDGDGVTTGDRPPGLAPRVGRGDVAEQLALMNQYRASIGLPSKNLATAPIPLAPVTMRSTFFFAATFKISSAGFPSWTTSSTTYPAFSNLFAHCSTRRPPAAFNSG